MTSLRLTGPQIGELEDLLAEAFTPQEFDDFLLYRLNRNWQSHVGREDDFPTALGKIVRAASRKLWWLELLTEVRNALPTDPGLQEFAERFGVAPGIVLTDHAGRTDLRSSIRQAGSTFDVAQWRRRLGAVEGRVCRVEYPEGTARGTGFLVGPEVVLTNYHVMEDVIRSRIGARHVVLRFDYKTTTDGVPVQAGACHRLAPDWLVDASPYSMLDIATGARAAPAPHELDYVLLLVTRRPGAQPPGGEIGDRRAEPRGWIEAPSEDHDFDRDRALYIVQHPAGRTLQVALDTNGVLGANHNRTRVRYSTPTAPGSSGSPCFGANWTWVAVHHRGDPKYWHGGTAAYGQGIPVPAIRALAAEHGAGWVFGGERPS